CATSKGCCATSIRSRYAGLHEPPLPLLEKEGNSPIQLLANLDAEPPKLGAALRAVLFFSAAFRFRFNNIEVEQFRQIPGFHNSSRFRFRQADATMADEVLLVDASQREKQFWSFVEAGADTIKHGCDVLAHTRRIRAGARE